RRCGPRGCRSQGAARIESPQGPHEHRPLHDEPSVGTRAVERALDAANQAIVGGRGATHDHLRNPRPEVGGRVHDPTAVEADTGLEPEQPGPTDTPHGALGRPVEIEDLARRAQVAIAPPADDADPAMSGGGPQIDQQTPWFQYAMHLPEGMDHARSR